MRWSLRGPWTALSFLTRLVPPPPGVDRDALSASVPWYPLAGLAVAAGSVLIPALVNAHFLVRGWLYVLTSLWITRGLHWDGLADLTDALGSGRHGDQFQAVLKDSRIGAFGVMALSLGLIGQVVLAGLAIAAGNWLVLLFAPVAGRMTPVLLGGLCPAHHPGSALGKLVCQALCPGLFWSFLGGLPLLAWLCLGGAASLWFMTGLAALLWWLRSVAGREGGVSGDYFGCGIVLTELAALAAVQM